jgi:hypothetical protein
MRTRNFSILLLMIAAAFTITTAVSARSHDNEMRIKTVEIANGQMKISGQHFSDNPLVVLSEMPLTVLSATETQIVVDVAGIAPGNYHLFVSRDGGETSEARANVGVTIE